MASPGHRGDPAPAWALAARSGGDGAAGPAHGTQDLCPPGEGREGGRRGPARPELPSFHSPIPTSHSLAWQLIPWGLSSFWCLPPATHTSGILEGKSVTWQRPRAAPSTGNLTEPTGCHSSAQTCRMFQPSPPVQQRRGEITRGN